MDNFIKLKKLRIDAGLSLADMAIKMGLSGNNAADRIREFESGRREISGPMLKLIEQIEINQTLIKACEVSLDALTNGESRTIDQACSLLDHAINLKDKIL